MKNKIFPVLFAVTVLLTANQASAYYSPSTGRWLSRDPMGEPGFETLRAASAAPRVGQVISTASLPPSRLLVRDCIAAKKEPNRYAFVANSPINTVDSYGLCQCIIVNPLQVKLTPPRDILGKNASIYSPGPADKAVWDGEMSRVWFTMKATFNGGCCAFRQTVRNHTRVGNNPPEEDKKPHDDTDYNYVAKAYTTQSNGEVEFSDYDNPGWEQSLLNPDKKDFGGWNIFEGYVIDVCNGNKKVGPTLHYGFQAYGTPPGITVDTWGFSQ